MMTKKNCNTRAALERSVEKLLRAGDGVAGSLTQFYSSLI